MRGRYGLEGANVLLTGAGGGIGRALAAAFSEQGATLLLVDRDAAALEALAQSLRTTATCHALACDLGCG